MIRGPMVMQAISDRTNPIVIKELRQAVQSRLVIAILLLFLLANVIIVSGYLIWNVDIATSERAGQDLFSALFVVLVVTCMIFVPLYAAIRLTMERNDSNIDLLFITTIAPAAIIRGKFWAAVALTALIYSASMPYLTFTYLLRGIDLPSIFFALGVAFLLNVLLIMIAIFLGSVPGGLLLRILMGGALIFVGGCIMFYAVAAGISVVQMGLASTFATGRSAWGAVGTLALVGLGVWGLFYLLAVAAVSARSSNRMFPVRVFLTAAWLILGVVAGIWALIEGSHVPVESWAWFSVSLLSAIMLFTLAERESWSPRVRRYIPRRPLFRFLAWLFFTGSAGGVIWCVALATVTLLASYATGPESIPASAYRRSTANEFLVMVGVFLFAWCYGMTGLFLRRMIVPKTTPLLSTTIGLVFLGLAGSVPLLLTYLVRGPNWQFESLPVAIVIANPFVLQRKGPDLDIALAFLVVWALFGFVVNIPWFREQWQAFQRHEPKPIPPPASLAEESSVIHA